MEKDRKRGMRRARSQAVKHKRKQYQVFRNLGWACSLGGDSGDGRVNIRNWRQNWKHPQVCSCAGCGNPRRSGWQRPETLAEQSFSEAAALQDKWEICVLVGICMD